MVSRLVVIFVPFFNILQVKKEKKEKKKERKRMSRDLDPRKWEAEGTVRRGPSGTDGQRTGTLWRGRSMTSAGIRGCGGDWTPREVASEEKEEKAPQGEAQQEQRPWRRGQPWPQGVGMPSQVEGRAGGEVRKRVKNSIYTHLRPHILALTASSAPGAQA